MLNDATAIAREQETLTALFDLGRQVTSVLDLDQLLAALPMSRYFAEATARPLWDMVPVLQGL